MRAQEQSNKPIAHMPNIGKQTVDTHVSRILSKLSVPHHAQAS